MTQELAESVKRLRVEYKQLAQYESLKTISQLVQLVGEMYDYIAEDESTSWMPTKLLTKSAPIAELAKEGK